MDCRNLPRVAAVHDISGFGKCALTIALPVISACGVEVSPLPTAVLSSSTNLAGFTIFDFTPYMMDYIDHWAAMDLRFDAIYSGFLGSADQIDIVKYFVGKFSPPLVVIDPVMGDNGLIYKTYTPRMCERMRDLVCIADVVTPNLTEACVLIGKEYDPSISSSDELKDICGKIRSLGARRVIVTGIKRDGMIANAVLDGNDYYEVAMRYQPSGLEGAGDLFSSVMTGGLLTGHTLRESVRSAASFISFAIEKGKDIEDPRRGICFEPYLHMLKTGVFRPGATP